MSSLSTLAGPQLTDAIRLHQAGSLPEAEDAYRRLLATEPDHVDALRLLGALRFQRGDGAEAEILIRRAIGVAPDNGKAHDNLGFVLHGLGRDEEALLALRRAVELAPENGTFRVNLANLYTAMRQPTGAVDALRQAVLADPRNGNFHQLLAAALLKSGDAASAKHHLETCIALGFTNANTFAHMAAALSETGDSGALNRLMDFDRLIVPAFIGDAHGASSLAEFNAALAKSVLDNATLHPDKTTINGMDTGEFLALPEPSIVALRNFIRGQIEARLKTLPLAGHPFHDFALSDWRIVSWGVRMWRQGYQVPHVHHHAWLSGVYYVQLPAAIQATAADSREGWIEFGQGSRDLYTRSQPELRMIKPIEGMLLTFPSYMWHRTIPFESSTERISIAFDVNPAA